MAENGGSTISEAEAMHELAKQLWERYFKPKTIEELLAHSLEGYKAQVIRKNGNGTLTVARPYDNTPMTLRCTPALESSAVVGDQVLVVELGEASNSFILCGTDLSGFGGGDIPASDVTYDNDISGLVSSNVQEAIDELALGGGGGGGGGASETIIATVEPTTTASKNFAEGDYLILSGLLYRVISPISAGATITVGTNVTRTVMGDELSGHIGDKNNPHGVTAAQTGAYVKPASGIPASDLASGVIPTVPAAATATPLVDGTGAVGSSTKYAREDHEHPENTGKADIETIAPVEASTTAAAAHALGTIFYLNGVLYRALSDISVGDTINTAAGGNATQTTIAQNFKRTVTLTAAQYAQLSAAEKTADIVYIVTDDIVDYAEQSQLAYVETGTTASKNYVVGEFFCMGGVLYRTTAVIASGTSFSVGTNCSETNVGDSIRARTTATTIFSTLTDVHTDTTITMDDDFTNYKFLAIIFNSRSPAASARRMPLLISTNLLPQGGFYPLMNDEVSGYIRINYNSSNTKQVRFQATTISTLYVSSVLGIT